ncbi:MAG TPA: UxaA family hydrolase [Baekduia sp.]
MTAEVRVLVLNSADNVAVAVAELAPGEMVEVDGVAVEVVDPIPSGHKVALRPIDSGGKILKYGEVIGIATAEIGTGAHVHVHNVVSARLPGTVDDG